MSFCGVALEAAFILSVFVKPGRWRYMLTSTGLALPVGFYLFHDVLWWPWWLAFLSFATPWTLLFDALPSRIRRWLGASDRDEGVLRPAGGLRPIHAAMIVLVCIHGMLRLPAGFGRFESYSNTYNSTDEFDSLNAFDPVDRLWADDGSATGVEIESGAAVGAIARIAQGEPLLPDDASNIAREVRESFKRLTLTRQQKTFDWRNGRFTLLGPPVVIGSLDLESMALVGEAAPSAPSTRSPSR